MNLMTMVTYCGYFNHIKNLKAVILYRCSDQTAQRHLISVYGEVYRVLNRRYEGISTERLQGEIEAARKYIDSISKSIRCTELDCILSDLKIGAGSGKNELMIEPKPHHDRDRESYNYASRLAPGKATVIANAAIGIILIILVIALALCS